MAYSGFYLTGSPLSAFLLAANINFVSFSAAFGSILGQIFTIFVLGVAAAEVSVGLAIIVIYFRSKGDIKITQLNSIKDL